VSTLLVVQDSLDDGGDPTEENRATVARLSDAFAWRE